MPGEKVGNNQNQGENTNETSNVWTQTMAEVLQADVVDANGKVLGEAKAAELVEAPVAENVMSGDTAPGNATFDQDGFRAAVANAEAEMPKVEAEPVVTAAEDLAGAQQTGSAVRRGKYYVIGEGVAETPETKANGTAKPETRLYFDSNGRDAVVQAVQVEEVEVPQSAAQAAAEEMVAEEKTAENRETKEADKGGRENLDAWLESIKGTPEEYWQKLAKEKGEKGVELGEMPDLAKVDKAIANFFENGLTGVTGEAREVREAMAKKAILNDIAKLKERGGELNDETMRNVFYGTQRMLEEMYRGNRELREDAQEAELSSDEEVAWHLKMEPRKAKMNVLLVMQQNTRRPGEGSDAYEARLRNYAEDTLEHKTQLEDDQKYNAAHPDEAAEYAAQVLKNGQKDDLPEFKYLAWDEVNNEGAVAEEAEVVEEVSAAEAEKSVEREGRIKRLFEKVRGRIGFQKIVDKAMSKVAKAIVGAVAWAEGVLAEEQTKADVVDAGGNALAEGVAKAEITDAPAESSQVMEAEPQVETERERKLRELNVAKAETEKRMAQAQERGDSAKILHWAEMLVKINAKVAEVEAEDMEMLAA